MNSFSPPLLISLITTVSYIVPVTTEIGLNPSEPILMDNSKTKNQREIIIDEKLDDDKNISSFTDTKTESSSTDSPEFTTDSEPRDADISTDSTSKYSGSPEIEEIENESPGIIVNILSSVFTEEEKNDALRRVRKEEWEAKKAKERNERLEYLSKGLTDVRLEDIISEDKFELCKELNESKKDLMAEGEAATCKQYCLYRRIKQPILIKSQNGKCKKEQIQTKISNKAGIYMKTDRVCYCDMSKTASARFIQIKDAIYFVFNNSQSSKLDTVHDFLLILKSDLNKYKRSYIEERQKKWDKKHRIRNIFRKETDENWFNLVTNYVSNKVSETGTVIMI